MKRLFATTAWLCALLACTAFAEEKRTGTGIPGIDKIPKTKEEAAAVADRLESLYKGKTKPESVQMFLAIARGKLNGESGWFGPARTRHDYDWLAKVCKVDPKDPRGIPRDKFPGADPAFAELDRDGDGRIQRDDLDWSPNSRYVQSSTLVANLFRQMDARGKGKLTKDDLTAFFEKAGKGKDHLSVDDLRAALLRGGQPSGSEGMPSAETFLRSLFTSELGSLQEGPSLGDSAPDFELKRADCKGTVKLSSLVGKKPVVLVLGNVTCGPFRATYARVEEMKKKYAERAEFLMVYVREAHPTDGWSMKSNEKAGVSVAQPRTDGERTKVAAQCAKLLTPTMPLVVDGVDDKVGNAYSGMPGRFYVIDPSGKVAYKSGRGPFGFKVGELEQALVMALLEAEPSRSSEKSAK